MTERKTEEKLFQRWIPYQSQMGYEEFKNAITVSTNTRVDERKVIDILVNVRDQYNKHFKKGG